MAKLEAIAHEAVSKGIPILLAPFITVAVDLIIG
jgi:hypothetical protein